MSLEKIAIAADHAGYDLKCTLKQRLVEQGFDIVDLGTDNTKPVDYPDFAGILAQAVSGGRTARGVLLCGSGIGMSIAANRFAGVRAALGGQTDVMVTLVRGDGPRYDCGTGLAPLADVAGKVRTLPEEYLDVTSGSVTPEFIRYLRPLVGPLPRFARLT